MSLVCLSGSELLVVVGGAALLGLVSTYIVMARRLAREHAKGERAILALRHRTSSLDEAQMLTHIGSWEWRVKPNQVEWSDELYRIYGIPHGSFDGSYEAFLNLVHPDDRQLVRNTIEAAYKDHTHYDFEHRIVRPDGTIRIVQARGRIHVDENTQEVLRLSGTGQDITERRMAEMRLLRAYDDLERRVADRTAELVQLNEELGEAVRARDMFLSIASHELRTPLNALGLAVESLVRDATQVDRTRHELILRQVSRLSLLVENLLEVSRITAGRLQLVSEEVELGELTRDVVQRFEPEAKRARATINVALAQEPVSGLWDRLRIEQVLTNLLSNALKYGAGEPIDVYISATSSAAKLIVRDHGIGISKADQARIFEAFQRVVSERHVGGFGLGLWIVRQIVEALGGSIQVVSAPGAGAEFVVTLPRVIQPVAPVAVAERGFLG